MIIQKIYTPQSELGLTIMCKRRGDAMRQTEKIMNDLSSEKDAGGQLKVLRTVLDNLDPDVKNLLEKDEAGSSADLINLHSLLERVGW